MTGSLMRLIKRCLADGYDPGLEAGLQVHQYTALQVKKAVVGYGRAEKNQVQQMIKVLLNLREFDQPEDASDALAVALTHFFWGGRR